MAYVYCDACGVGFHSNVHSCPECGSPASRTYVFDAHRGARRRRRGAGPLREDAENKGKLIKAASDRHASPDEACKLITNFGKAKVKMISYITANSAKCGIPPQIGEQLKAGHKNTELLQAKVCNVAQQMQTRGPAGPSLSEVLGSATAVPEATASKKGGSTFDTLNGNVLSR